MASPAHNAQHKSVSISPLLTRLAYPLAAEIQVEASEIASAFALIFEDRLNVVQTAALLTLLHSTRKDKDPTVIAQCSQRMREAASQIERPALRKAIRARGLKLGLYRGGLVGIQICVVPSSVLISKSATLSAQAEIPTPHSMSPPQHPS